MPPFRDIALRLPGDLLSAFALLTRLPLPNHRGTGAGSAWAWPLVGAVLGACGAALASGALWLGVTPGVTAVLVLALGAMLAFIAYVVSVVSLPLLLDRDTGIATAIRTSLQAFSTNTFTLLAWAATIVTLTLAGFATFLFGLVVIMPILGHASWHAYRDLVEWPLAGNRET